MQSLTQPTLLLKPFAESGDKNSIPTTNTDTSNPQRADLTNGFPAVTSLSPDSGGLPPERKDFNGLGYLTTTYDYFYQAGGTFTFNSTISTAIGGYPQNARLWYTDANGNTTVLRSTKNDNTDNFVTTPSYIGTSWVPEIPALGWDNAWTGSNVFKSIYENSSNLVKGTTPSSNKYLGLYFCDQNGTNYAENQIGQFQLTYSSEGSIAVRMNCLRPLANSTESASFGVGYETDGTTQYASASNGVKKSIVEWEMPNYGAGVSKSASTNYTETSNGFLYVSVQRAGGSQGIMSLKIGSKTFEIKSNDYSWDSLMFPIARGVTYSYTLSSISNYTVTFYPCIGG